MRIPKFVAVLVASTALIAACGDDGDDAREGATSDAERGSAEDTSTTELADGVAAVIDGDEISVTTVDEQVDAFADDPQFAEQLKGADGKELRAQLRAQILSTVIVTEVVAASAEELGQPVTEKDIAETRAELEQQVGGAEALDSALEQQGYTASLLELELTGLAGMGNVEEALTEKSAGDGDQDAGPDDKAGADGSLTPSQQRAQEFLRKELADADVSVDKGFGTWNPETGKVLPPGGAPESGTGNGG